jgi:cell wall-associated NlpC family hydrolase
MMMPVFVDDERWAAMEAIARSWIGTPYRHMQCVKGRGADCALFIGGCFLEAGYLTRIDKPRYYPRDWALHTDDEYVLEGMYENTQKNLLPGLKLLPVPDYEYLLRGDWVAMSTTRRGVKNHACIMLDECAFIHSSMRSGVGISGMDKPMSKKYLWGTRPRIAYRLFVEE